MKQSKTKAALALVLWGLPKGKTDALHAVILSTQCSDDADVARIKTLASKDGFHSFSVQVIDGSLPDFAGCIAKSGAVS